MLGEGKASEKVTGDEVRCSTTDSQGSVPSSYVLGEQSKIATDLVIVGQRDVNASGAGSVRIQRSVMQPEIETLVATGKGGDWVSSCQPLDSHQEASLRTRSAARDSAELTSRSSSRSSRSWSK